MRHPSSRDRILTALPTEHRSLLSRFEPFVEGTLARLGVASSQRAVLGDALIGRLALGLAVDDCDRGERTRGLGPLLATIEARLTDADEKVLAQASALLMRELSGGAAAPH